jgi:hypothetical protein
MFRRRRHRDDDADDATALDDVEAAEGAAAGGEAGEPGPSGYDPTVKPPRPHGPWDVSELDGSDPSHERPRVDFGALRIRPMPGTQIQVQVDAGTNRASSLLLVGEDAVLQLLAVAAARSVPLWPARINAVAADATRRGGTAQRSEGPWGPQLHLQLPATTSTGASGVQPSIVLGIDGPRWMLRATVIGKAAIDPQAFARMLAVVQDTVVVRGDGPMAPGEVLELRPPPSAPVTPPGTPPAPSEPGPSGSPAPSGVDPGPPVPPSGTSLGQQGGQTQGRPIIGG